MQIVHHIGLRAGEQERLALQSAGIELPSGEKSHGVVSFEISEDDLRWERVHSACRQFSVIDTVTTKFTDGELHAAEFLGVVASGQFGFPEPSEDGRRLDATFDVSGHCRVCGIGAKQIAPFRVKKPPGRKNSLVQLNWIVDEYFVAREVWTSVFNPLGVKSRPVLLHQTGRVIDSIVQISIDAMCDVAVDELPRVPCAACGRIK